MRLMFTWVLGRYVASTVVIYYNPDFWEGADSVAGQLRGDKECPLQWRHQFWQSLEEDAGK